MLLTPSVGAPRPRCRRPFTCALQAWRICSWRWRWRWRWRTTGEGTPSTAAFLAPGSGMVPNAFLAPGSGMERQTRQPERNTYTQTYTHTHKHTYKTRRRWGTPQRAARKIHTHTQDAAALVNATEGRQKEAHKHTYTRTRRGGAGERHRRPQERHIHTDTKHGGIPSQRISFMFFNGCFKLTRNSGYIIRAAFRL